VGIAQLVAHAANTGKSVLCMRGGDAALSKLLSDFVFTTTLFKRPFVGDYLGEPVPES